MKLERVFQMPNHKTFEMKVVKDLINSERNIGFEFDAFLHPYKLDALELMKQIGTEQVSFGLYDPPYSQYQLAKMYKNKDESWKGNGHYFKLVDSEWDRIVSAGGKVIKFGWNSKRISKNFEIIRIMLINHGAQHNDTIVTVQKKTQTTLGDKGI
jgi:hypothetical protein